MPEPIYGLVSIGLVDDLRHVRRNAWPDDPVPPSRALLPGRLLQAALRLRPANDTACSDRPSISWVMPDSTLATTANSRPC